MLKKLCFLLLLPVIGYSQSLNVSVDNRTEGNQYTTFGLANDNVTFSGNGIDFPSTGKQFGDYLGYGVNEAYTEIGILQNTVDGAKAFLINTQADTLLSFSTISLSYSDPSLGVYPFNSGEILIRNNIANFTLYNSLGDIATSSSTGSQSEQGESISEVASDPAGNTIVVYTPKIKQGNNLGSQAQVLKDDNSTEDIFFSSDRYIKFVEVSGNGQFIILITARNGTNDKAVVLDRFGNELNMITSEEDLAGGYFSGDNEHLILHSSRRGIVYSSLDGERLGSTSFRSPLVLAQYFAEDNTIVGLTGNKVENTDIFRDLEFHAINLEQREIARKEYRGALGTSPSIDFRFFREGSGRYRLQGTNKIVNLRASF